MKIDFRTDPKNVRKMGAWVAVDSSRVIGENGKEFLSSLTAQWVEIPENLLDSVTAQNFICYARLPLNLQAR